MRNYQLEYDRTVGRINSGRTPGVTNATLEKNAEHLKQLGASAVMTIGGML